MLCALLIRACLASPLIDVRIGAGLSHNEQRTDATEGKHPAFGDLLPPGEGLVLTLDANRLDQVLASQDLDGVVLGACVMDGSGKVLYERNADLRLVPASNQKLLTCAYALRRLGASRRIRTRFWRVGSKLVVDAPGDPTLTMADLLAVKKKLHLRRKTTLLVRQAFRVDVPPTWEHDELGGAFPASVTAWSSDGGRCALWASHGRIEPLAQAHGLTVRYLRGTGSVKVEYDPYGRIVRVYGALPKARTLLATLPQPRPDASAAAWLGCRLGPSPSKLPKRRPDLELAKSTVGEAVRQCLVVSDNGYAERLLLMAAATEGSLGRDPYAKAAERLKTFLVQEVGLRPTDVRPIDGSGRSRHDLVTARGLCRLLLSQTKLRDFLPGPDQGTLHGRLKGLDARAKTGSLDGVSSLSGYLRRSVSGTVVFSVIMNGTLASPERLHALQDRFIRVLADEDISGTVLAGETLYALRCSNPRYPVADGDRIHRPRDDGAAALSRAHLRAQSADEATASAERVAVRVR